ncbi:hypothetical protein Hamer_G006997 [Homarus americanus]|uniref:Uncharacterized protein n=1 Tax=Homarus americanus TaxID=6706 RepID=A0A8J5N3T8_HOMAM|nr:hypothetical protein Hamer_G006997 [Homarus americanus]
MTGPEANHFDQPNQNKGPKRCIANHSEQHATSLNLQDSCLTALRVVMYGKHTGDLLSSPGRLGQRKGATSQLSRLATQKSHLVLSLPDDPPPPIVIMTST